MSKKSKTRSLKTKRKNLVSNMKREEMAGGGTFVVKQIQYTSRK